MLESYVVCGVCVCGGCQRGRRIRRRKYYVIHIPRTYVGREPKGRNKTWMVDD